MRSDSVPPVDDRRDELPRNATLGQAAPPDADGLQNLVPDDVVVAGSMADGLVLQTHATIDLFECPWLVERHVYVGDHVRPALEIRVLRRVPCGEKQNSARSEKAREEVEGRHRCIDVLDHLDGSDDVKCAATKLELTSVQRRNSPLRELRRCITFIEPECLFVAIGSKVLNQAT